MMNHRKKIIIGISVIALFLVVGIGVTYSLWSKTFQQSGENKLASDCFHVTFEEVQDTSIHLENTFPMTDQEGSRLKPYRFKVKNNCDAFVKYDVLLDVPVNVTLKDEYLKVKLDQSIPNLLSSYPIDEKNQDEKKQSYILDQWYLKYQEEREYSFWVWLDENLTQDMEGVQNVSWSGKIRISAAYSSEGLKEPGTLRRIASSDQEGMWGYKENITKIVIQNKLDPIENAEASYDESILQDESVKSYVVPNGDGTYTGYLQSYEELVLNSGENLFYNFSKVAEIEGLEYVNTSNVDNMQWMFWNCSSLTSLDLSHFDTSNVVNMQWMFWGCSSLTSLDLSHFDTSNVVNMQWMFRDCTGLTSLDVSHFDTSKVTDMSRMFDCLTSLSNLDVSSLDTSSVTDMGAMFSGMSNLTSLDVSNFDTRNVTNMFGMFAYMRSLQTLNLTNFDTGNVIDMSYMFDGLKELTNLDVKNFDTSNVTNMTHMFTSLENLTSLDVSSFDTSKVTDMSYMFYGLKNLTSLDLSNFNTSNITDMSYMFRGMSNLISLDIGNFDTRNVINMTYMFTSLENLTSLDVSSFDTRNVTNMSYMFYGLRNLTSLDIRNFNIRNESDMTKMFQSMSSTATVQVKNQDTQTKVLNSSGRPLKWSTSNVVIVA